MRGIPIPAVYQRGQVDAQLERGKCVIGLPDGGGDGVGCLPCNTVRFGAVIRTCQNAGCLAKLDACRLSEPKQRAVVVHLFNTQKPSRLIEKAVAGDADCLPDVQVAMLMNRADRAVVHPAGGLITLEIGILTGTLQQRCTVNNSLGQRRRRHSRLEGGAGCIQTVQRPVVQRQRLIVAELSVVAVEGGQVVGRIGRQCQYLSGVRIHGDCRAGTTVLPPVRIPDVGNIFRQPILRRYL